MTRRKTLISVIIPIYKVESFLRESIDSILASSYPNLELILVDDGSPDGSPAICDEYATRDNRVSVIHKSNGGASDARNVGVSVAKGEYIIFVDGDDYWSDSDALADAVATIEAHPDIDLLCFDCATFTPRGIRSRPPYDLERINGKSKAEALSYMIEEDRLLVTPWSKFVRRSLLVENNIRFRCGIRSEDYDWTLQILIHSRVLWAMSRNFYVYRIWDGSVTSNISKSHLLDIMSIIGDWHERIPREVESRQEMDIYFDILGYIYGVLMSLVYIAPDKELLATMHSYNHLLGWTRSPKLWKVALLYHIVGFNLCWRLLGLFNRYRAWRAS